jgi:UDP-N-acetylglucosamine 3-dehydrogenase
MAPMGEGGAYRAAIVGLTGIAASAPEAAPDPVVGERAAHSHAAAYAALAPRATVAAVCDLVPSLVDGFGATWAGVFPDARGYADYRELLANERIDLLSVVTSDHRHAQIVLDALEAGVRGIFCEKPIATTLADADRMIAACARAGVPLLINHTRRWYPEYLEARRLVRAGAIGRLTRIVATLGGPRAMLFRNGTHLVDMICFFAESEPVWVAGVLDDEHAEYPPRYAGEGGRDPAIDPGGSGMIRFESGLRAFVNASKGTIGNFELDLIGEAGRLRISSHVGELWRSAGGEGSTLQPLPRLQTSRAYMHAALSELIDLVERGGEPSSSGADARRVLSILLGLLQSSAAGGARVPFPIHDA